MRLKLDLGEFLNDERRLSLLCVKTEECKTVGDVITRICRVFSVGPKRGNSECNSEVALFDDGFFIHPNQCSSALEESGVLKLQWLRSQDEVKKKKQDNIDDIELVEVKRSKVKVGDSNEWENEKGKSKRHTQENDSTQVKECDLDTLKKKRKKKAQNIESKDNKKYKKTLEVCEIDEKVILNREAECSKSKKKKIIINNIDVKELVEINHGKKDAKGSKRKKKLSQEHVQKENDIAVENIESSSEELTIVDSLKSNKCKLKKVVDTIREDKPENKYIEYGELNENGKKKSRKEEKNIQIKINCEEKADSITVEAEKLSEEIKSAKQFGTENIDINQEKTDSEDNKLSGNARQKRRRRRRHKKPQTMLSSAGKVETPANIVVPSTSSYNSRKSTETQMYNFSYARPRNKKPMTRNGLPQINHIIFDNNDDVTSIQNIDPVDDNVTKRIMKDKSSNSLWDVSDITVLNDSHYDRSIPGASTPGTSTPGTSTPGTSTQIIPPPEVKIGENSCSEISSTSMHKFTLPTRKLNTAEENENIFGVLLEMSKSERPTINTYVGRKVKEKSNNCTSTVSSATEQSQRRSPPKGVPTHIPQSDEISCIFHNLLATQNFSQAFICPRTPSISKLSIVRNIDKQPEISSTDVISTNESGMSSQAKEFINLDNYNDTNLEEEMESIDILKKDDTQENNELEKEIEEMKTFTKLTVEANMAEAKAAMNRRKRCRPKAISSIGNLLNRIRTRGVEVQSIDAKDKLEKITSTIDDTNESEMCINSNESSMLPSYVPTPEDENLNSGEKNNLKPTDQQVDLITENLMQSEIKNLENCEIKTVDNTHQKSKSEVNEESELEMKDEVCVVEADLEVTEIKESDCAIINTSSDKVSTFSPKRREQILSGGLRQGLRVTRSSIKTEITLNDEDDNIDSPIKVTKSYNELGEAYFNQFPIMKGLPKVKEFVAVKLLSLDENLIPVYSNYQQAQVLKLQGTSITLRYIDKLEELPSKDGQLHVVDLTLEGDDATETVDWRDVYEPRLIFP